MRKIGRLLVAAVVLATALAAAAQGGEDGSFVEEFGEGWRSRWKHSTDEKYTGRFETRSLGGDLALKVPEKAVHYGVAALLKTPVDPAKGLVLQYEAKWESGHTCGGGYLKYFTHDPKFSAEDLVENTPYTVMFGPDKCGGGTNKVHLIIRHENPKNGTISEKHLKKAPKVPGDSLTHVYTAVLKPDNTFELLIDGEVEASGSLFDMFDPPFNPPEQIPDPTDKKPDTWVDNAKMPDPDAKKPDDWVDERMMVDEEATKPEGWLDDEPKVVNDPEAVQPDEWDEDEDGIWEAPKIPNPKCESAPGCGPWTQPEIVNPAWKGAWKAPMIDNPDYKGPWEARKIPNPDYYEDKEPLKSIGKIGAVGIEIWTMDEDLFFDNVIVSQQEQLADLYREKWNERNAAEKKAEEEKRKQLSGRQGAAAFLQDLADKPEYSAFRPYLLPIIDFAETNTVLFYGILLAMAMSPVYFIAACCRRTRKPAAADAAVAKKTDRTEPDDKPAEKAEDEDEDGKVESDDEPSDDAAKKDADDDEEPSGVRRRGNRTRRAD